VGPHPHSSFDLLKTTLSLVEGSLALAGAAVRRFPPAARPSTLLRTTLSVSKRRAGRRRLLI
jgi:hypothetical protein